MKSGIISQKTPVQISRWDRGNFVSIKNGTGGTSLGAAVGSTAGFV